MRVAALVTGGCHPDRANRIAANEALLARMPHYPGSTRVGAPNLPVEASEIE
jgi:hypothetical protein